MNGKKIFQALRNIDPELILAAAPMEKTHTSRVWLKWGALAACLFLLVGAVLLFLPGSPISLIPHAHVFGEWETAKDATCMAQGEEIRVCSCGEKEVRYTAILPHFAGEWVIEREPTIKLPTPEDPNEREPGLKCQFCENCGAKLGEELIPATGSLGLAYAINPDGKTFAVAGIGNCTDEEIIIPENFCGYHVTTIGKGAFEWCEQIKSITFPETIVLIEESAFYGCNSLESLTLPQGLLEIGSTAFRNCRLLEEIVVPQSVTKIGSYAFSDNRALEKVVLPNGLREIAAGLFSWDYQLTTVELPQGITSIGELAFDNCSALKHIDIPKSVTSIGRSAFEDCYSLLSIALPEGIEMIQGNTFSYCEKLVQVTLPSTLTEIGWGAFSYCYALKDIQIPASVTRIGTSAFAGCRSLTSLVLPEGLVGIEASTFAECTKLVEINIPDSVTYIGAKAFADCYYLVEVENNVSYVDNWAVEFEHGFVDVTLREGTVGIARSTFEMVGVLERLTIPSSVKYIGEYAFFSNTILKEIVFDGTQAEWDAVQKEENWDRYLSGTKIVFSKTESEQ